MPASSDNAAPARALTLFDATCLIVGIILGAGIYQTAPSVAIGAGSAIGVVAIWLVGGALSLCGAFGYAELATALPRAGGDYVYLGRAYGGWAGFLFGWIQTAIVRPGDIAVMAFIFATYACSLYDPLADTAFPYMRQLYAAAAVAAFSLINIAGVREGKWTQNILTCAKVLGLLAIIAAAALATKRSTPALVESDGITASVALILVLFTYGGWNEMAYVAAEVKNPRRNIVRTLMLGTLMITLLYVLANLAFLKTLGFAGLAASDAVAVDAIASVFPTAASRIVSVLVCVSALGAVNGLIFAGARISYAVGADHAAFRALGRWHPRTGTPIWALVVQGAIALTLILAIGSFIETLIYTSAAVYTFYLATSLAVIVLRRKEPNLERPYRVTGYPFTTIVFCCVCAFLIYGAIAYKPLIATISLALIPLGLPVYWVSRRGLRLA